MMREILGEDIVMNLVCNGGDCRSKSLEAIRAARAGAFDRAEQLLKEASEATSRAHEFQTDIIQSELQEGAEKTAVSVLMVHGQDHLMDGMVVYDLAVEIVELLKELKQP